MSFEVLIPPVAVGTRLPKAPPRFAQPAAQCAVAMPVPQSAATRRRRTSSNCSISAGSALANAGKSPGYTVSAVHAVDMFPHTPHVEAVVVLDATTAGRRQARPGQNRV